MGVFSGILGNASEVDAKEVENEILPLLADSEQIKKAFKLVRDLIIFTDKRLILVDKQGITGKKIEYHSIPYKAITHFAIETSGHLDLDAELKIWISGSQLPITKEFKKDKNIFEVQKALAIFIAG
jgi:hypothetical protein